MTTTQLKVNRYGFVREDERGRVYVDKLTGMYVRTGRGDEDSYNFDSEKIPFDKLQYPEGYFTFGGVN